MGHDFFSCLEHFYDKTLVHHILSLKCSPRNFSMSFLIKEIWKSCVICLFWKFLSVSFFKFSTKILSVLFFNQLYQESSNLSKCWFFALTDLFDKFFLEQVFKLDLFLLFFVGFYCFNLKWSQKTLSLPWHVKKAQNSYTTICLLREDWHRIFSRKKIENLACFGVTKLSVNFLFVHLGI